MLGNISIFKAAIFYYFSSGLLFICSPSIFYYRL